MRKPSASMIVALLALFVALGGVGVAATGDNFILGQSNTAADTSSLSAPVGGGKALQVSNTSATSGSTALGLSVASGHAPLTVNSPTKVGNLNADLLDGIDSTGFLRKQVPVSISGSAPGDVFDSTNTGSGYAVSGTTPNGTGAGVHGSSSSGRGVEGLSGSFQGVYGHSNSNAGVVGESTSFDGVYGVSHAGTFSAVSGHNSAGGFALWGDGGNAAKNTAAIHGQSGNGNAVEGISQKDIASGVYGENDSTGYGVAGRANNGTGVLADSANGYALNVNGKATQARAMGGLVKAMAFVDPIGHPNDPIQQCFNSQVPPSQATNGNCGLAYSGTIAGVYHIDFGFQIDDRFVSATVTYHNGTVASAGPVSRTQVDINTSKGDTNIASSFYIFIY